MAKLGDKYRVFRTEDNAPVEDAFVLRVRRDPAAWLAAWRYAEISFNDDLAQSLREWLLENTPHETMLSDEGEKNETLLRDVRQIVLDAEVKERRER